MSKNYLRNLSQEEYNDLSKLLYEKQCGKCFVCNKDIPTSLKLTNILSLTRRRKFHIEDYALCHKKCNIEGLRDEVLKDSIENNLFVSRTVLSIELDGNKKEKGFNYVEDTIFANNVNQDNDGLNKQTVTILQKMYDSYWSTFYYEYDIKIRIRQFEKIVKKHNDLKKGIGCIRAYMSLIEQYQVDNDKRNEERIIKLGIEQFGNIIFERMLNQLNGENDARIISPNVLYPYGEKYDKHIKEHLPEFDFYTNKLNPFKRFRFEEKGMLPIINVIKEHWGDLIDIARDEEAAGLYDSAIEICELLIAEGINTPIPFEELIKIYTKMAKINDVKTTIQRGIKYFEERKAKQIEYVRYLAKKYNAEDYCEMCIRDGKEIRYYCGGIVLYQNYTFVDKWKKQLEKLIQ